MNNSYTIDINNVSKRIHVTLPDSFYKKLELWATSEARPVANLASYLLQKAIEEAEDQGKLTDRTKSKNHE
jgi:hypothetical protein